MGESATPLHDPFHWLGEINKASAVMVAERGIVPRELGMRIADAVVRVIAEGDRPDAFRSGNYLHIEPALIAAGGPDVTRLHSGRSRQDIGATMQRLAMRDDLLTAFDRLNGVRAALVAMAQKHRDAVVPAYTWGVQAQPITLGHYLLAYASAFARTAERIRQAYARVNLSPLGAAALGTSSFPVDRPRLAELLGFSGVAENSFDATQVSPIDVGAEIAGLTSAAALTIATFAADLTQQYAFPRPWFLLTEGDMTGTSSIMPQKRNPSGLVFLRTQASTLLGHAQTFLLVAHNIPSGMSDYKPFIDPRQGDQPNSVVRELAALFEEFSKLAGSLSFNAARALAEVEADYSTTTELADTLQRVADVPFRIGHHFASELVNFGRRHGFSPAELDFAEAQRIYAGVASDSGVDKELPLTEKQFRTALSPRNMVAESRGLGGPQPAEVARMLADESERLVQDDAWMRSARDALADASRVLDHAFARLRRGT